MRAAKELGGGSYEIFDPDEGRRGLVSALAGP